MGQILSNPVIDKEHHSGEDLLTAFGTCAMQGWRMSMEDSHIVEPNVLNEQEEDHIAVYSIFDGHGGSSVAQFAGKNMVPILLKQNSFKNERNLAQCLIDAYLSMDEDMLKDNFLKNDHSGCTATSILISKLQNLLVCANSGDSRTVLATKGVAKALSYDHKPTLISEKSRIMAADGFVEMDRVNGNLALSRAIGDFEFKSNEDLGPHEQIVTCVPDIIQRQLNYDDDEFVILACDGIWDCLSSQECVDLIYYGINKGGMSLNDIASRIIDVCCSPTTEGTGIGCDNMSITIVALLKENENVDQWFERLRSKKYDRPISFELKRRVVYSYFEFPSNDEDIFETTTKKPEERFSQESSNGYGDEDENLYVEDTDADDTEDGTKRNRRANNSNSNNIIDGIPLETILGGGITLSTGPNNEQYISGNLNEMLASFRKVAYQQQHHEGEEEDKE